MTVRLIGLSKVFLGVSMCVRGRWSCMPRCCCAMDWQLAQGIAYPASRLMTAGPLQDTAKIYDSIFNLFHFDKHCYSDMNRPYQANKFLTTFTKRLYITKKKKTGIVQALHFFEKSFNPSLLRF